mmetsp:Transcript_20164/g.66760  ORF Transcript_20164/g.66760 Transcript_20164/m.66760 type:complete len:352 (+) Transcript_20164:505-1560(+)
MRRLLRPPLRRLAAARRMPPPRPRPRSRPRAIKRRRRRRRRPRASGVALRFGVASSRLPPRRTTRLQSTSRWCTPTSPTSRSRSSSSRNRLTLSPPPSGARSWPPPSPRAGSVSVPLSARRATCRRRATHLPPACHMPRPTRRATFAANWPRRERPSTASRRGSRRCLPSLRPPRLRRRRGSRRRGRPAATRRAARSTWPRRCRLPSASRSWRRPRRPGRTSCCLSATRPLSAPSCSCGLAARPRPSATPTSPRTSASSPSMRAGSPPLSATPCPRRPSLPLYLPPSASCCHATPLPPPHSSAGWRLCVVLSCSGCSRERPSRQRRPTCCALQLPPAVETSQRARLRPSTA